MRDEPKKDEPEKEDAVRVAGKPIGGDCGADPISEGAGGGGTLPR